jgi:hypothetical protein
MGGVSMELQGTEEIAKALGVAHARVVEAAKAAVYGQGLALIELANRKGMVPVETGALRSSAYVTEPEIRSGNLVIEIGYGVEYADERHELEVRTVSKGGFARARNGVSKWLEKAVNIHARALPMRLSESLRDGIIRGTTLAMLTAAGVPTKPPDLSAGVGKYQRKYGFTKSQAKALRGLKRAGHFKAVRRWRRPAKKR